MPTTRWTTNTPGTQGRIYLSGVQALVRLPLMQQSARRTRRRPEHRRLHFRLSRLAAGRLRPGAVAGQEIHLEEPRHEVPARASTRTWARPWSGAPSRPGLFPGAKVDGVFGMWYGKGPAWTAAVTCSSTPTLQAPRNTAACWHSRPTTTTAARPRPCRTAASTEFVSAMMPVLNPAGVQDILDMGLLGFAMSRFTGRWVGFKTIAETVESSASVYIDPHHARSSCPTDFEMPAGRPQHPLAGSAAGPGDAPASLRGEGRAGVCPRQQARPHRARLGRTRGSASSPPARAISTYCRRSNTSGIERGRGAAALGIRVYKVGMTWPLEPVGIRQFAAGCRTSWWSRKSAPSSSADQGSYCTTSTATPPERGRQVRRARRMDPAKTDRRADPGEIASASSPSASTLLQQRARSAREVLRWMAPRKASWRCRAPTSRACRITAPAARTTPRPRCRKARARMAASAAITW
jgi:hypothetical protein